MVKWRHVLKSSILLALLALLVLCTACEGGTSGSVSGSRQRCSSGFREGQCSGSFKTLKGTYSVDVENDSVVSQVDVEVQASAESGPIKVWIKTPDDETKGVDIPAGGSGSLSGTAKGEWDGFRVYFEAVDGEAGDVTYEITYQVP